jgi:hypothetical protein
VALLALTGPAVAEGMPQRVHLTLPACAPEPFSYDELEAVLRLELEHAGVGELVRGAPPVVASGEALLVLLVPCSPTAPTATLVLRAPGGELTRSLDLSDLDATVRPRGIALQVAELLPSAWPELLTGARSDASTDVAPTSDQSPESTAAFESEPAASESASDASAAADESTEPPPDVEPEAPLAQPVEPRPAPARRWAVGGAAQMRAFLPRGTTLFGARPMVAWGRFDAAFDLLFGRHTDVVGQLDSRLLSASLAYRALQPQWGTWRVALAPRASLGTIVVQAASPALEISTSHVREVYADLAMTAGVAYVAGRCVVGPEFELGYAHGFIAQHDQEPVADFGGPLLSARLAVICVVR